MKTSKSKGSMFTQAKASSAPLAIRPQALSLFWAWGLGTENATRGRTMVVSVEGPLEQRAGWWDGYDAILERFRAACGDTETTSIALRIDSPGGECAGLYECARLMLEAKEASGKRVVAYADESAYSAAYAIACIADEIYLPPSGGVGSVGVIATCLSQARMMQEIGIDVAVLSAGARKADCHPDLPLSEEALASVQADVDALAVMFRELVAASRGVSPEDVAALEAGCFMGDEALAAGLADGVMGFDELVAMLVDETKEPSGSPAPTEGTDAMKIKNASGAVQKAGDVVALDSLARPQVAVASVDELAPIAARLDAAKAGTSKTDGTSTETTVETETEENEEGTTSTTTTTTTETETAGAEVSDDEPDDDDEEESDDKEEAIVAAPAPLAIAPRNVTSAAVLKAVRDLTGETSPAAQLGALQALSDRAAKADKLAKDNRKAAKVAKETELKALVEQSCADGRLEPARKAWALTQSVESLRAYLKGGGVVAHRTPIAQKPTKGPSRTEQPAVGEGVVSEAIANVARAMQMDPKAVQAHADELRKAGQIH
jgi:ClpP class serine protease